MENSRQYPEDSNFPPEFDNVTTMSSVSKPGSPFLHVVGTDKDDANLIAYFGNSIVEALDGNDTVNGSKGNDEIYGGNGDDTYIYGRGYGNDTIYDSSGKNKVKFTNLMPNDLTVYYPPTNTDAILTITSTGETLTFRNFRSHSSYRDFVLEFKNGRTGKFDYSSASIMLDPLTVVFGVGYGDIVVPNDVIGEIKFDALSPADLTAFYDDNNAVLTITSTGEMLTIEDFSSFAETQKTVLTFDNGVEMKLDSEGSPFLNVVGTDSDDVITAFYKNSSMFGGIGNDTYSLAVGFGANVIEDNDGDNTIKFLDMTSDAVSFEMADGSGLIVTNAESGDVLAIRRFVPECFSFEFADGVSGFYDTEIGEFKSFGSESDLPVEKLPDQDEGENLDNLDDNKYQNPTDENGEQTGENNSGEGLDQNTTDENGDDSDDNSSVSGDQTDNDNLGDDFDQNTTDENSDGSESDSSVSGEQTDNDNSGEDSGQNTSDENDSSEKQPDISDNDNTQTSDMPDGTIIFGDNDGVISAESSIERIKFNESYGLVGLFHSRWKRGTYCC